MLLFVLFLFVFLLNGKKNVLLLVSLVVIYILYWLMVKCINVLCLKVSKGLIFLVVGFLGKWVCLYCLIVFLIVCLNLDFNLSVDIGKLFINRIRLICYFLDVFFVKVRCLVVV